MEDDTNPTPYLVKHSQTISPSTFQEFVDVRGRLWKLNNNRDQLILIECPVMLKSRTNVADNCAITCDGFIYNYVLDKVVCEQYNNVKQIVAYSPGLLVLLEDGTLFRYNPNKDSIDRLASDIELVIGCASLYSGYSILSVTVSGMLVVDRAEGSRIEIMKINIIHAGTSHITANDAVYRYYCWGEIVKIKSPIGTVSTMLMSRVTAVIFLDNQGRLHASHSDDQGHRPLDNLNSHSIWKELIDDYGVPIVVDRYGNSHYISVTEGQLPPYTFHITPTGLPIELFYVGTMTKPAMRR